MGMVSITAVFFFFGRNAFSSVLFLFFPILSFFGFEDPTMCWFFFGWGLFFFGNDSDLAGMDPT